MRKELLYHNRMRAGETRRLEFDRRLTDTLTRNRRYARACTLLKTAGYLAVLAAGVAIAVLL